MDMYKLKDELICAIMELTEEECKPILALTEVKINVSAKKGTQAKNHGARAGS